MKSNDNNNITLILQGTVIHSAFITVVDHSMSNPKVKSLPSPFNSFNCPFPVTMSITKYNQSPVCPKPLTNPSPAYSGDGRCVMLFHWLIYPSKWNVLSTTFSQSEMSLQQLSPLIGQCSSFVVSPSRHDVSPEPPSRRAGDVRRSSRTA